MASVIKITTFILVINLFLFIGISYNMVEIEEDGFHADGDLFDTLLQEDSTTIQQSIKQEQEGKNITPTPFHLTGKLTQEPNQATGAQYSEDTNDFAVLDALKIFWSVIPTMFNIITVPIRLMGIGHIPIMVKMIIAIPLAIMEALAIFLLIRGIG